MVHRVRVRVCVWLLHFRPLLMLLANDRQNKRFARRRQFLAVLDKQFMFNPQLPLEIAHEHCLELVHLLRRHTADDGKVLVRQASQLVHFGRNADAGEEQLEDVELRQDQPFADQAVNVDARHDQGGWTDVGVVAYAPQIVLQLNFGDRAGVVGDEAVLLAHDRPSPGRQCVAHNDSIQGVAQRRHNLLKLRLVFVKQKIKFILVSAVKVEVLVRGRQVKHTALSGGLQDQTIRLRQLRPLRPARRPRPGLLGDRVEQIVEDCRTPRLVLRRRCGCTLRQLLVSRQRARAGRAAGRARVADVLLLRPPSEHAAHCARTDHGPSRSQPLRQDGAAVQPVPMKYRYC
eukprot:Rhum_TRINITY_DN14266_c30_g1::Rhum_TRINITY_DN14266_c30_g1_i1::g.78994::m.78994